MGQTPDQIRTEIEETRDRMTETAHAIGHRADVKGRAKETVAEKKHAILDKGRGAVNRLTGAMPDVPAGASTVGDAGATVIAKAGEAGGAVTSAVKEALPDRQQIRHAASVAQANPVGLTIGAAAVGFIAGMLVPTTRTEDEKLGPLADQVKDQAKHVGEEALQHGQEVAKEAVKSAAETVQQEGEQHGEQLAETLQESAKEERPQQ
jgi:gas vesicle protein